MVILTGMILACGAGVAAATALTRASPEPISPGSEAIAVPGSDRIGAGGPDPEGGPPWAVRSYTGASGRSCLAAARLEDGRFGPLVEGRIRPLPLDGSGSCADLAVDRVQLIVSRFAMTPDTTARTAIFGRAEPDITSVVVDEPSATHAFTPSADGTFLVVVSGLVAVGAVHLSYRDRSGGGGTQTV